MDEEAESSTQDKILFQQLDSYPWHEDDEFQGGLQAILGSVQDAEQAEHLTTRAKCYYFARKAGRPVDFDGYKQWIESHGHGDGMLGRGNQAVTLNNEFASQNPQSADSIGDAPKPASFAEICDMIAEGRPIPGIKDIPDTILEGQATTSKAERRKKPWESDATSAMNADEKPTWMT